MKPLRAACLVVYLVVGGASALADDVITNVMSAVASYQYPNDMGSEALTNGGLVSPTASYQYPSDCGSEALTNGGVASLIASYQYPSDLGSEALASGGLMSRVASYQYFDWPGGGVLGLLNSPSVSYFYDGGALGASVVVSGQVVDGGSGAGVTGASVQLGTSSAIAGAQGRYSFAGVMPGQYPLSASKAGYSDVNDTISIAPGSSPARVLTLQPSSSAGSAPRVTGVTSKYPGFRHYLDGPSLSVRFTATVDWADHPPGKVQFITPRRTEEVTTSGATASQSLGMGSDFGANGRLRVVAVSSDGTKSASKVADLVVMPSPFPPLVAPTWGVEDAGSSFSYNASFDTTIFYQGVEERIIPKSIPVLGDHALKVEFIPAIECAVNSGGTATLAMKWDNLEAGQLLESERKGGTPLKNLGNLLADLVDKGTLDRRHLPHTKFGGLDLSLYPELGGGWKYDKSAGQWQANGAFAGLGADLSVSRTWPFVVGYVPMYAKLKAELAVEATANLLQLSPLQLAGEVNVNPSLRGSLGVGISEMLAAEGWVEGGANIEMIWPQGGQPASLYVKAGATLYYLIGHRDYSGLIWSWPESGSVQARHYTVLSQQGEWKPLGRGYNNYAPVSAFGARPRRPQFFGSGSGGANPEVLMSPAMPFADPNCSSAGTNCYLVFLEDNTNRTSMNRTMAMFSKYDGTMWSLPVAVADDGAADFHPRIVTLADGSAVAAWENEGKLQPDTATLSDMVTNLEVSVAWYSPTGGTWRVALQMTTNSFLDRSPRLAGRTKDDVLLTWIANGASDPDGSATAPNQIWWAKWDGSAWGAPQLAATISNALVKYDLAYDGTNGNLVMSVDTVAGSTNANGRDLFRLTYQGGTWGAMTALTADQVPDDNPQMTLDAQGNVTMAWLKGGELSSVVNFSMGSRQVARTNEYSSNLADFKLASGADGKRVLVWAEPSENNSDLFGMFYDPVFGTWGAPRQFTHDAQAEYGTTAVFGGTNELIAVYNRTMISATNSVDTSLADLAALYYTVTEDLAMDTGSIYCDPPNPGGGAIVTLHGRALNLGDRVETNMVVAFYQNVVQRSAEMGRVTLTNAVAPQGSNDVAFAFVMPDVAGPVSVFAVIDPDQAVADLSRSNNVARVDLGKPDIGIAAMDWSVVNSNLVAVTVHVANEGVSSNGPVTLSVYLGSASGTLLFSESIGWLVPGASVDLSFLWDVIGLPDNLNLFGVLTGPGISNNFGSVSVTGQLGVSLAPPLWIGACEYLTNGSFQMEVYGAEGRSYALQASTDLVNWTPILNFVCTNAPTLVVDTASENYAHRFYRIAPISSVPRPSLGLGSAWPLGSNGLDLVLFSQADVAYRIDASADLVNWTTLTNFTSTNSVMHFMDSTATNYSRRFYRAVVP